MPLFRRTPDQVRGRRRNPVVSTRIIEMLHFDKKEINMTQKPKEETKKNAQKQNDAQTQVAVRWDDSKMRSTYANVVNVSSTREEVTLLFGTNQGWQNGQRQLKVELSDRIVLNPYAAKRLSIMFNNVVREYEKRFGELPIEPLGRAAGNAWPTF